MKFRFIKKVDYPVTAYGVKEVVTGDVVELNDLLSEKALKNPNYELMSDVTQDDGSEVFVAPSFVEKVTKKKTKKKRGRPRKYGNES